MVVFVGIPPLRRKHYGFPSKPCIKTAKISFFGGTNFWDIIGVPMSNSTPMELVLG